MVFWINLESFRPFSLSSVKPRKSIDLGHNVHHVTKARKIPKGLFDTPPEQIALEKIKAHNREKAKMGYEVARLKAFQVTKYENSYKSDIVSPSNLD